MPTKYAVKLGAGQPEPFIRCILYTGTSSIPDPQQAMRSNMACLKCDGITRVEGQEIVCQRCGRREEIAIKIPSQAILWQEVQELRAINSDLIDNYVKAYDDILDIEKFIKEITKRHKSIMKSIGEENSG